MNVDASTLPYLEITQISELIRSRQLTSTEVTAALLDRIETLDGEFRSYAQVTADRAREDAARADSEIATGGYRGPLHGVPISLKDLVGTEGITTAAGTTVHADYVPAQDSTVAARLRAAGSVLLGKVRMTEGAFTEHHPDLPTPVNPWDADTWPGVSSSGSGVATAAGLCFGTLGSDTGGSIRFPSGANGVTGLKPTWGRVSRAGTFDLAPSLDHIGPMTRSARDAAAMFSVIAGWDPQDPTSSTRPVAADGAASDRDHRPVIGIDRELNENFDTETQAMLESVVEVVADLGWSVLDVRTPDLKTAAADWSVMCGVETALVHEATYPDRKAEYGPALAQLIELGLATSGVELQRLLQRRRRLAGEMNRLMEDIDILLLPSIGQASPTLEDMAGLTAGSTLFERMTIPTAPIDMWGGPSLTLPAGFTTRRTPLGVQFVGAEFSETQLLDAGTEFQRVTEFHKQHPAL